MSESGQTPTTSTGPSGEQYEQFLLLAKHVKGAAAVKLLRQVFDAPSVYVFGELLQMPNIQELEKGEYEQHFSLLKLFAYGTYKDYLQNKATFPEITNTQCKKLKHLTIVTLATKSKCIPYATLLTELDITNVRELEDLIIEAIYADIIHGKLDQKNAQLEIDYALGRDVLPEYLDHIVETLETWCNSCDAVLTSIDEQINRANSEKNKKLQHKECIEQEIGNIKKMLKTSSIQDMDEGVTGDSRDSIGNVDKGLKKFMKGKGLKGKLFQK